MCSCCCYIPAVPCVPILAGGFAALDILHYRTVIFSAIKLSEYRILYRIAELKKLSEYQDIGSRPQSIRLSDIGLSWRLVGDPYHTQMSPSRALWFQILAKRLTPQKLAISS